MLSDVLTRLMILLSVLSSCSCENSADNDKYVLLNKPDYKLTTVSTVLIN